MSQSGRGLANHLSRVMEWRGVSRALILPSRIGLVDVSLVSSSARMAALVVFLGRCRMCTWQAKKLEMRCRALMKIDASMSYKACFFSQA